MKKLITFVLVAVVALGVFTACRAPQEENSTSSTTATTTTTTATTTGTTAPTTAPTVKPTDGTLDSTGPSESGKMPQMPRMR